MRADAGAQCVDTLRASDGGTREPHRDRDRAKRAADQQCGAPAAALERAQYKYRRVTNVGRAPRSPKSLSICAKSICSFPVFNPNPKVAPEAVGPFTT